MRHKTHRLKTNDLQQLRAATSAMHKSLEELTGGAALMENPERSTYTKLLSTHYRYHCEVASHINKAQKKEGLQILDWPDCNKLKALLTDLKTLGAPIPAKTENLDYQSREFAIGLCYVAEGSAMGNKMMYQRLQTHSNFLSWRAQNFFEISIAQLPERWRRFTEQLSVHTEHDYDAVEAGGIAGFRLFAALWQD